MTTCRKRETSFLFKLIIFQKLNLKLREWGPKDTKPLKFLKKIFHESMEMSETLIIYVFNSYGMYDAGSYSKQTKPTLTLHRDVLIAYLTAGNGLIMTWLQNSCNHGSIFWSLWQRPHNWIPCLMTVNL